jgi:hypothetical protein
MTASLMETLPAPSSNTVSKTLILTETDRNKFEVILTVHRR